MKGASELRAPSQATGLKALLVLVVDRDGDTRAQLVGYLVPAPVRDKPSQLGLEAESTQARGAAVQVPSYLVTTFRRHLAV
jgi:hypothetical protein